MGGARGLHDREGRVRGIDPGCKAVPGGHASPARICEGREKLCHLVRGEPQLFPDGSGYVTDLHTNSQTESVTPFLRKRSRTHFCKENLGDVEVDESLSQDLASCSLKRPSLIKSPGR